MFGVVLVAIVFVLLAYVFHKLSLNNAQYFEQRNLKYVSVAVQLKNLFRLAFRRDDIMEMSRRIYAEFPNEP